MSKQINHVNKNDWINIIRAYSPMADICICLLFKPYFLIYEIIWSNIFFPLFECKTLISITSSN